MLNEGMFAGSKGYVLKPPGYRGDGGEMGGKEDVAKDVVKNQATAIEHKTLDLSIEVLAAQDIPLPLGYTKADSFHPYVKIELHVEKPAERTGAPIEGGGRAKEGEYKWRGRTVRGAGGVGTGVDFGGEKVVWKGIEGVVEELGFIRYVSGRFPVLLLRFAVIWGISLAFFGRKKGGTPIASYPSCYVFHNLLFHTLHQLQSIFTSLHKHITTPFKPQSSNPHTHLPH